jgi:hypothetical protein
MVRRLATIALALAACSSGEPRAVVHEEMSKGPAPVYRCNPDQAWQPAPFGEDIECVKGGDLICPAGDCRVAFRHRWEQLWALDIDWTRNGGRQHPVALWEGSVYRVYPATTSTTTASRLITGAAASLAH